MRTLGYLLPGLTCGGGMAFCMWMMSRGGNKAKPASSDQDLASIQAELNELRAQVRSQPQDDPARTTT